MQNIVIAKIKKTSSGIESETDETPIEVLKTDVQREAEENIEDAGREADEQKNQDSVTITPPSQLGFSLPLWARRDSAADEPGDERETTSAGDESEAGDEEEYERGQKKRFKQRKPTRMRM